MNYRKAPISSWGSDRAARYASEARHYGGEVKRWLRLYLLSNSLAEQRTRLKQLKHAARFAWHAAGVVESARAEQVHS